MKDYYRILGVTPDASADEIKRVFRRLARETHPDANPGDSNAEVRFREIAEAYEVLSDPAKRAAFDRGDQFDISSLFSTFAGVEDLLGAFFGGSGFGRASRVRTRGADIMAKVEITLEEAALGVERDITFHAPATCTRCQGAGAEPDHPPVACSRCGGRGVVRMTRRTLLGEMASLSNCDRCRGSGRLIEHPCALCFGSGVVGEDRSVAVQIPAGIGDGVRLRLSGRGGAAEAGGPAGDLYVDVAVGEDARWRREGDDLIHTAAIGIADAALGVTIQVPLIGDAGDTSIDVPGGTQPGAMFRIPRQGMPRLRGRGRGDLLVEIVVRVPTELSADQEALLRSFAGLPAEEPVRRRKRRRA